MKYSFLVLIAALFPLASGQSQESGEKWWAHELAFTALPPEQDPPWTMRGKNGVAELEEGKLVLSATNEQQSIAYTLDHNESVEAVTIEFRVRVRELLGRFAAQFNVAANGKVYVIPITNTESTTYRAVLENGIMTLYREGDTSTLIKGIPDVRTTSPAQLLFGDSSSAAFGVTEWSLLRWIWGQAVHGD